MVPVHIQRKFFPFFYNYYLNTMSFETVSPEKNKFQLQEPQNQVKSFKKLSTYASGQSMGKWNVIQQMKYIVFLEYNRQNKLFTQIKKSTKFYKEMSSWISSRNALQCRSHHQKMIEKYQYPNKIIKQHKNQFNSTDYEELYIEYTQINSKSKSLHLCGLIVETSEIGIQTQIKDVNVEFITKPEKVQRRREPEQVVNNIFHPYPQCYGMPPFQNTFTYPTNFYPNSWQAAYSLNMQNK